MDDYRTAGYDPQSSSLDFGDQIDPKPA